MKQLMVVLLTTVFIAACASSRVGPESHLLGGLSLGISRSQAVSVMGNPSRVSANDGAEYLIYLLVDDYDANVTVASMGLLNPETEKSEYFVKIVDDEVVSFGKVGEFGENIR